MRLNSSGATLIEMIVSILIVAILAAVSSGVIISLAGMFVYIPRDITLRTAGQEIVETMVEGEPSKSGMRYAVTIQDASPTQFSYTFGYPSNMDKRNIRFKLENNKIYRFLSAYGSATSGPSSSYGAGELIPAYIGSDVSISGPAGDAGTVFTYYKSDGTLWVSGTDDLNTIRRAEINLTVSSGDSKFTTTSSSDIKEYI